MTLLEAAKKGAEWMKWWLENEQCDCDMHHICGKPARRTELRKIEAAILKEEGGPCPECNNTRKKCVSCGQPWDKNACEEAAGHPCHPASEPCANPIHSS